MDCEEERRNTAKEKKKRNKKFPYRARVVNGKLLLKNVTKTI